MKVLSVSFSVNGSLGDSFKQISRYFANDYRIQLTVLSNSSNVVKSELGDVELVTEYFDRKKNLSFFNVFAWFRVLNFVLSRKFDVIFIYSPHPINFLIYPFLKKTKVVTYAHSVIPHSGVKGVNKFFLSLHYWLMFKYSKKIIVAYEGLKKDLLDKYKKIANKDVYVVRLGLLENHIFLDETEKVKKEDIDVLFFGRLEYYKGLDILIKSSYKVNSNYKYVVIAKGSLDKVYSIKRFPSNFEHINTYVPDRELAEYIKRSKLVVLPYRDACGTQVIQSVFAYKKTVIVSNVGCFPEYVKDGITGIIVPPEDVLALSNAIDELLSDDNLRYQLGYNGYLSLKNLFDNKKINDQIVSIFKEI